jgi:hypothetical protein
MKPFVWQEGMSAEETKNFAYWERNMLVLVAAKVQNFWRDISVEHDRTIDIPVCGWYTHGAWEGWSRVISLFGGAMTFHIPDDFEVGNLPEIEPNWDGHSTELKWNRAMFMLGIKEDNPDDA